MIGSNGYGPPQPPQDDVDYLNGGQPNGGQPQAHGGFSVPAQQRQPTTSNILQFDLDDLDTIPAAPPSAYPGPSRSNGFVHEASSSSNSPPDGITGQVERALEDAIGKEGVDKAKEVAEKTTEVVKAGVEKTAEIAKEGAKQAHELATDAAGGMDQLLQKYEWIDMESDDEFGPQPDLESGRGGFGGQSNPFDDSFGNDDSLYQGGAIDNVFGGGPQVIHVGNITPGSSRGNGKGFTGRMGSIGRRFWQKQTAGLTPKMKKRRLMAIGIFIAIIYFCLMIRFLSWMMTSSPRLE